MTDYKATGGTLTGRLTMQITPEMEAAGVAELCLFDSGDRSELLVRAIFDAMLAAYRTSPASNSISTP